MNFYNNLVNEIEQEIKSDEENTTVYEKITQREKSISQTDSNEKNDLKEKEFYEKKTSYSEKYSLTPKGKFYFNIGTHVLNKCCLLFLAGGQGTRLGTNEPKGLFYFEKLNKNLFDIHLERIRKIETKFGLKVKVLFMTSESTHEETLEYLKDKDFDIEVFKQESIECLDLNKELFVYEQHEADIQKQNELNRADSYSSHSKNNSKKNEQCMKYAKSPNGNGGLIQSLHKSKILFKLLNLNYLYINIVSIDNVLGNVLDPLCVGLMNKNKYDILSKSVLKKEGESAGCFIKKEGGYEVLEYSENNFLNLDENEPGLANICHHYFRLDFIKKLKNISVPYHLAKKKIPSLLNDQLIKPNEPNGYKQEKFIFDYFKFAEGCEVVVVPRENEFSPLKNGYDKKEDNPDTCQADYLKWIEKSE